MAAAAVPDRCRRQVRNGFEGSAGSQRRPSSLTFSSLEFLGNGNVGVRGRGVLISLDFFAAEKLYIDRSSGAKIKTIAPAFSTVEILAARKPDKQVLMRIDGLGQRLRYSA